jgi:hypothetical protein
MPERIASTPFAQRGEFWYARIRSDRSGPSIKNPTVDDESVPPLVRLALSSTGDNEGFCVGRADHAGARERCGE